MEYDRVNGALLGYECTIYFDAFNRSEIINASETTYTLSIPLLSDVPRGFSVAAVNEVGIGDHCPSVNLSYFG